MKKRTFSYSISTLGLLLLLLLVSFLDKKEAFHIRDAGNGMLAQAASPSKAATPPTAVYKVTPLPRNSN